MFIGEKEQEDPFTPGFERFKHITRHYEETGDWLWRGQFTKPDGRLDLHVPVPKEPMSWLISAFSVSRNKGLGVTRKPTRVRVLKVFIQLLCCQFELPRLKIRPRSVDLQHGRFMARQFGAVGRSVYEK